VGAGEGNRTGRRSKGGRRGREAPKAGGPGVKGSGHNVGEGSHGEEPEGNGGQEREKRPRESAERTKSGGVMQERAGRVQGGGGRRP